MGIRATLSIFVFFIDFCSAMLVQKVYYIKMQYYPNIHLIHNYTIDTTLPRKESMNYRYTVRLIIIIITIIIIIFIETRLQDTIGKIIKYRWLGSQVG